MFDNIDAYLEQEFVCEHSRDLFEKIDYGCYNELGQILFLLGVFLFIVIIFTVLFKGIFRIFILLRRENHEEY